MIFRCVIQVPGISKESRINNAPPLPGKSFPYPEAKSSEELRLSGTPTDSGKDLPGLGARACRKIGHANILPDPGKGFYCPRSMSLEKSGRPNASPMPGNNRTNGERQVRRIARPRQGPLQTIINETAKIRHMKHISRLRTGRPGSSANVIINARQFRDS